MKKLTKILFALLILLIVFAGIMTFIHQDEPQLLIILDENVTIVGNNSNGTVYKIMCGNASSNDTAILILGVHSLEGGIHNATYASIMNLTEHDNLSRKFIVYFIQLNYEDSGMNTSEYNTNRHMGELLAYEYVVPDIENYDPYIVMDVHEMESYWDEQKYVGVLNNKSSVEMEYADTLSKAFDYPIFRINAGTSPKWVTVPISKKGHDVILFETPQKNTQYQKSQTAVKLIKTIDSLPIY